MPLHSSLPCAWGQGGMQYIAILNKWTNELVHEKERRRDRGREGWEKELERKRNSRLSGLYWVIGASDISQVLLYALAILAHWQGPQNMVHFNKNSQDREGHLVLSSVFMSIELFLSSGWVEVKMSRYKQLHENSTLLSAALWNQTASQLSTLSACKTDWSLCQQMKTKVGF